MSIEATNMTLSGSVCQCCIDLKRNVLVIGTTGRETPFLGEGDVPEHARLNRTIEPNQPSEDQQLAEALQRSAQEAAGLSRFQSCVIFVCSVKIPV